MQIKPQTQIAAACSGGADSLAMTILLAENYKVTALIVDHALRKESASEALATSKILTKFGIENHILTHKGKKPKANLQEAAREIRYKLLIDFCKKNKIKQLATAHHADDNAETFLLRLSRGSGVDGLSGIAANTQMEDITILRPVLSYTKTELEDFLKKKKIKWVEDPTNKTDKYKRNQLRHALDKLEDKELITKRINEAALNLARARDFLEQETKKAYKSGFKSMALDAKKFAKLHDEIAFRLLVKIICDITNPLHKPRFENIKHLKSELIAGNTKTLGGLIFRPKKEKIIIEVEKSK